MNGQTERAAHLGLDLAAAGLSGTTVQTRAGEMLRVLNEVVANDAGWLALRDPERHRHNPLAATGEVEPLRRYFERAEAEAEVEELGLNARRPPLLASEIPAPLPEVAAWADHLLPAGLRGGLAAGLFTTAGRHVGFLSRLSEEPLRLGDAQRRIVQGVTRVIADGLDRTLQMAESARVVVAARAGVVLTRGGSSLPLPGLPDDRLLAPGSPVLVTVANELATTPTYVSFLVPAPHGGPEDVVRVTGLNAARPGWDHLVGPVLLSAPGDLRGLGRFSLQMLGLLAEGITDPTAMAAALSAPERVVVQAMATATDALGAADVTAAAARAVRTGLRIPPSLASRPPPPES
jgi:hypothetical protein